MRLNRNKPTKLFILIGMLFYSNYCLCNISDRKSLTLCIAPLANNTGSEEYDAFADGFSDLLTAVISDQNDTALGRPGGPGQAAAGAGPALGGAARVRAGLGPAS